MESRTRRIFAAFVGLWTSFSLGLMAIACAPPDPQGLPAEEVWIEEGQQALYASKPEEARLAFADALVVSPNHPRASFYLALCDLLLLPEGPAAQALFRQLGMQAPDMSDHIYGARGLLAQLSRGQDPAKAFARLRVELGGPEARWTDPSQWLHGLPEDSSLAGLAAVLGMLSQELTHIGEKLHLASANPNWEAVLPGKLLHLRGDLGWGAQEAAILAALTDGVAAVLAAVQSYSWSAEPLQPLASGTSEESAEELSERLATAIPPPHLNAARSMLSNALFSLSGALKTAIPADHERYGRLIAWQQIPEDELLTVARVVDAFQQSLYESTSLPTTEPPTRFSLLTVFERPPSPSRQTPAWQVNEDQSWRFNDHFVNEWLDTAGVASPPLAEGADLAKRFFVSEGPEDGWISQWFRPLLVRLDEDLGLDRRPRAN